jgi:long-chain fatty acid transport protein
VQKNAALVSCGVALFAIAGANAALAGGFNRGTAETDILFDPAKVAVSGTITVVSPVKKLSVDPTSGLTGVSNAGHDYADTYIIPSYAAKFQFNKAFGCAGTFTNVMGATSSYPHPKVSGNIALGKTSEELRIDEYGATCAAGMNAGIGRFSILGGIFIEDLGYDVTASSTTIPNNPLSGDTSLNINLSGQAVGWRAGIAYEIPKIGFRAQLLYRSGTTHSPDGTSSGTGNFASTGAATGYGIFPQSLEFKAQSGIAPGWVGFGAIKWTDWSINQTLLVMSPQLGTTANLYYWQDGWTVTGGVARVFNPAVIGRVALTWDKGVSTGYDLLGDSYSLNVGLSLRDKVGELKLGAGVSYLSAISETKNTYNYAVDAGYALAFSGGYMIRF